VIVKKRLQQRGKDVGAENDLVNNLGFNLCIAPRSLVVRLVTYFGVVESCQDRGPKGSSEGVGVDRRD